MPSRQNAIQRVLSRLTSKQQLVTFTALGLTTLAITGAGVYAALTASASNTAPQSISSGTLSLTMTNSGNGFAQSITNIAPGDQVNRFVTLTQGSALDAQALTIAVADSTTTKLTNNGTLGLQLLVTQCSVAWTTSTGVCSGTKTSLLTSTPLLTLTSTASTLVSGSMLKGSALYLEMEVVLPNQAENTVNGTTPAGTIQGLTSSLTWTFSESQRTATTTNS